MTQVRAKRRSSEEWLQVIQECRSSGLTDRVWCEQHDILVSSFYNAVKRLRNQACNIPESSNAKTYALDFTSANQQEAVRIDICPDLNTEVTHPKRLSASAMHLDNSHTMELTVDDVSLRIRNEADPFLLQQILQMLRPRRC